MRIVVHGASQVQGGAVRQAVGRQLRSVQDGTVPAAGQGTSDGLHACSVSEREWVSEWVSE